jgi:hypothetical protein
MFVDLIEGVQVKEILQLLSIGVWRSKWDTHCHGIDAMYCFTDLGSKRCMVYEGKAGFQFLPVCFCDRTRQ